MRAFIVTEARAQDAAEALEDRDVDFEEGDALVFFDTPDNFDEEPTKPSVAQWTSFGVVCGLAAIGMIDIGNLIVQHFLK